MIFLGSYSCLDELIREWDLRRTAYEILLKECL